MSRRTKEEIEKEKAATFKVVVENVLKKLEQDREWLISDKVAAYIPYRNARERLRKHDEHTNDVKKFGIAALTGDTYGLQRDSV